MRLSYWARLISWRSSAEISFFFFSHPQVVNELLGFAGSLGRRVVLLLCKFKKAHC